MRDNHEATIEIESARKDQDSLQISWKITGVENIDQIILSVREITADGLINDPLELVSFSETGSEIISWDGATNLSLFLRILLQSTPNTAVQTVNLYFAIETSQRK